MRPHRNEHLLFLLVGWDGVVTCIVQLCLTRVATCRLGLQGRYEYLRPKATSLAWRVPQADEGMLSFLKHLLQARPTCLSVGYQKKEFA